MKLYDAGISKMTYDPSQTNRIEKCIFVTEDQMKVSQLRRGETGYTVPWGLYCENGRLWAKGSYPLFPDRCGTAQVKITRDADGYYHASLYGSNDWFTDTRLYNSPWRGAGDVPITTLGLKGGCLVRWKDKEIDLTPTPQHRCDLLSLFKKLLLKR